ncbi:MAG: hypothetical protein QXU02_05590 [Candidatus Bathyarchaeia archaeon]
MILNFSIAGVIRPRRTASTKTIRAILMTLFKWLPIAHQTHDGRENQVSGGDITKQWKT